METIKEGGSGNGWELQLKEWEESIGSWCGGWEEEVVIGEFTIEFGFEEEEAAVDEFVIDFEEVEVEEEYHISFD